MEWAFVRHSVWLARPPHRPKLILVLVVAAIRILAQVTAGVWMWACTCGDGGGKWFAQFWPCDRDLGGGVAADAQSSD